MSITYVKEGTQNLIVVFHFLGKMLWVTLAGVFALIGYKLYAIGLTETGDVSVEADGLALSLDNAGPGLVVMVAALICALIGVIKSKVEITNEGDIRIHAERLLDQGQAEQGDATA